MPDNDRVLLDLVLSEDHVLRAPEMTDDEHFEFYIASHILRPHDLTWEQVVEGVVDGADDGGIDAWYMFENGELVDDEVRGLHRTSSIHFDLVILQAKRSAGFDELTIDRLTASLLPLLDLSKPLGDMQILLNDAVLAKAETFRNMYKAAASRFPTMSIAICYGSRGSVVHPKVQARAELLVRDVSRLYPQANVRFRFITPRELIEAGYRQHPSTLELNVAEAITTQASGYVALVSLTDYIEFVSDGAGSLRPGLFESNVRDYEGPAGVNAAISETLVENRTDEFWWLNNGVTVVAERAAQGGKTLTLEHPQIVNGLQTTQEIFKYISGQETEFSDDRLLLVRVVVPPDEGSRDRIIRATNSQTTVPGIALHATEPLQRSLESYFLKQGLYYERRRNRYLNEGKPVARIVTIPFLAEAVLAISLRRPHLGNPRIGGRFLRDAKLYSQVFAEARPLQEYLICAQLARRVEIEMRSAQQRQELRHVHVARYVMMTSAAIALERSWIEGRVDVSSIDPESVAPIDVVNWAEWVHAQAQRMTEESPHRSLTESVLMRAIAVHLVGEDAATRLGVIVSPSRSARPEGLTGRQWKELRRAIRAARGGSEPVPLSALDGTAHEAARLAAQVRGADVVLANPGQEPQRYLVVSAEVGAPIGAAPRETGVDSG